VWFCLNDGTAAVLVYEKAEDVISWVRFTTDGSIEDITVLPNAESDDVYMTVRRTIGGLDKHYREKLAYDTDAMGGVDNYVADSHVIRDVAATAIIPNLAHLEGKTVVVWAAGNPVQQANGDAATFVVAGGQIVLPAAVTGRVIVGLYYEGKWKSTKLAYAAQMGTAMSQKKTVLQVAPILFATHNRGIFFGQTFDKMDPMPRVIRGIDRGLNYTLPDYDYDAFSLPGSWDNDSRLCMKMKAPFPATILGVGMVIEGHERA
jgi:hypothetical protein